MQVVGLCITSSRPAGNGFWRARPEVVVESLRRQRVPATRPSRHTYIIIPSRVRMFKRSNGMIARRQRPREKRAFVCAARFDYTYI